MYACGPRNRIQLHLHEGGFVYVPIMRWQPESLSHGLLRIGVAFAFLYPPFDALYEPDSWIGYFPSFVTALHIDTHLLLHTFGVLEVGIALWILSGWKIRIPAVLAAALLIVIVAFNAAQFPVLFRDLAIAAAALALALAVLPTPAALNELNHA
jgi:uncharacterized membrane protein YphA (DoxX/SURF4 family)